MGRNDYEKDREREREKDMIKERKINSRSKSRSLSRSYSYKRRKNIESPRRERDSYDKTRNDRNERRDNNDKYYRRSRSPRVRYKRKTSRDNSAENQGKLLKIIKGNYQIFKIFKFFTANLFWCEPQTSIHSNF
jgi:hypothetical protein